MDLIMRDWSWNESEVNTCYLNSTFLGHESHQNLVKYFDDIAEYLDSGRFYQISMDGSSVNENIYQEIVKIRLLKLLHIFMGIGTWKLKSFHGAVKLGVDKSQGKIKEVLKGRSSSAR